MATPKQAHSLVSHFGKSYQEKYGSAPSLNRVKARWGFDSILMDMSSAEARALIDYYFETASANGHTLDWFFYHYDELAIAKKNTEEDVRALARIREATRLRTEEWRKKVGNN